MAKRESKSFDGLRLSSILPSDLLNKLTHEQCQLALWLCTPDSYREPKLRSQEAEVLGISEATLYRWQNNPDVQEASRRIADHFIASDYPEILRAIAYHAKKGSIPHINLYLEYVKGHCSQLRVVVEQESPLQELYREVEEELKAHAETAT